MTAFKPKKTDDTDSFFRAFLVDAQVEAATYEVVGFGNTVAMADDLLKLVLSGIKRATTDLVRSFGPEYPLPQPGDYAVVVDGRNKPRCVYRVTEIRVGPLNSVDDAFAFDEGEGDQTRAWWLRDHIGYFEKLSAAENFHFSEDDPAVFERFTVVWPRLFADDWTGPKLQ